MCVQLRWLTVSIIGQSLVIEVEQGNNERKIDRDNRGKDSRTTENDTMSELNLIIKSSNADKTDVKADPTLTVEEFKKAVSIAVNVCPSLMRLIYKGRVLKDECTLSFYGINEDGQTIHLVKGAGACTASVPAAAPVAAPAPGSAFPNPMGMGGMGMGGMGGMQGMQGMQAMGGAGGAGGMQEELMRNPQMMQQMMNSPFMEVRAV